MENSVADTLEMLAAAGISDALAAGAAAVKELGQLYECLEFTGHARISVQCSVCARSLDGSIFFVWENWNKNAYCSGKCYRAAEMWPGRKVDLNRWWPSHLVEKHARLVQFQKVWNGETFLWRTTNYWTGDLTDGEGRLKL